MQHFEFQAFNESTHIGICINARNNDGRTALDLAIENDQLGSVNALIALGASVKVLSSSDEHLFHNVVLKHNNSVNFER